MDSRGHHRQGSPQLPIQSMKQQDQQIEVNSER